jgi:hypothetical protein
MKEIVLNVWSWIEKNRFTVLLPVLGLLIWIVAIGCTPVTLSPTDPIRAVNAQELQTEYQIWLKENEAMQIRFDAAGLDLQRQQDQQDKFMSFLTTLASGNVADLPGLLTLLISSGAGGFLLDNIRKNGVIAGLKRNRP